MKNTIVAMILLLLTACATPRTDVRPIETVQSGAALGAGELRIAASALQSGDVAVARSLYTELSEKHPRNIAVWMGLGDAYFLTADYQAARTAYERARALDSNRPEAQLALARIDIRERNLDQAQGRYQAVLADRPGHVIALAGLGVTYDLSGQNDLAQQTYRKGLEMHGNDEVLRTNLGLSLALSGKPREAVNILLGYDGVTDSLPQRRDNLALAYGLLGREDAAENILLTYQTRGQAQDNLEFYRYLRQNKK